MWETFRLASLRALSNLPCVAAKKNRPPVTSLSKDFLVYTRLGTRSLNLPTLATLSLRSAFATTSLGPDSVATDHWYDWVGDLCHMSYKRPLVWVQTPLRTMVVIPSSNGTARSICGEESGTISFRSNDPICIHYIYSRSIEYSVFVRRVSNMWYICSF